MTVSEVRRLKELEAENAKLKRLLAEAELDKAALKDLRRPKVVSPQAKRAVVSELMTTTPLRCHARLRAGRKFPDRCHGYRSRRPDCAGPRGA